MIFAIRLAVCVLFLTIARPPFALAEDEEREPAAQPRPAQIAVSTTTTTEGKEVVTGEETIVRQELLHPTVSGQVGLFRVRSGESLPQGALAFGIGGEFYSLGNAQTTLGAFQASTIAESLFVGYSPYDNLTLSVMRRNSSTTFNTVGTAPQLISSLGDFTFGVSYSFAVSELLTIAPIANLMIASEFNALVPSGLTVSGGLGAAVTVSLAKTLNVPLYLHANLIYHSPQVRSGAGSATEAFYNFTRFNTVALGVGAELHLGDIFIPFVEYVNTYPFSASVNYFSAPSKVSIGTRITPLSNKALALLVGMDIGTGRAIASGVPYTPPAQVIAQVSYTTGLTQSERKHYFTTKDVNVVNRKFIIKKNINFKVGSAILEGSSLPLLNQIADVILKNEVRKLLIVGHTDSSHNEDFNLKLSQDRAAAVKTYLVSKGVSPDVLMTQGYGKRKPRASNATESGRALNRRVEFLIVE